jgi:hypothetical protein
MPIPCPPNAIAMSAINTELGFSATTANSSLTTRASQTGGYVPGAPNIQFSEFCGYSPVAYNTFSIVNTGHDSAVDACNDINEDNLTLYFAGSGGTPACPTTSVILYTDTALTNVFDGLFQYWRSQECNASYYILEDGFIEGITSC